MTAFDWMAGSLLVVCAVLGLVRGATRQLASIIAFFVAGALALALGRDAGHALEGVLHPVWLARGAGMIGIFLAAYLAICFVGSMVTRGVKGVGLSGLDRLLGLGIGVARGLVALGAVGLALGAVTPRSHMPAWIGESRLWPLASDAGAALRAVAPESLGLGRDVRRRVGESLADRPDPARGSANADRLQVVEDHP